MIAWMRLTSDDSCRVFLIQVLARSRARRINQANGIVQSGCQRQEMESARNVGGNGDRIYFVHAFLEIVSTVDGIELAMTYSEVAAAHPQRSCYQPQNWPAAIQAQALC